MESATPAVKDNRAKLLEKAMSRRGYASHALIEVLHTAQELFGFLSTDVLKDVAAKLKLPPSRVLGVATFYHFFSLKPKAEHAAVICTGTACYVAGAGALLSASEQRCKRAREAGQTPKLSVQQARCIGSCVLAPAVVLDGRILGKISKAALEKEYDDLGV